MKSRNFKGTRWARQGRGIRIGCGMREDETRLKRVIRFQLKFPGNFPYVSIQERSGAIHTVLLREPG